MGEQVSHRLCDMFMALLTLYHLAVLRHQGGWGVWGGGGDGERKKTKDREAETKRGRTITNKRGARRRDERCSYEEDPEDQQLDPTS